jgi:hypothetical protein
VLGFVLDDQRHRVKTDLAKLWTGKDALKKAAKARLSSLDKLEQKAAK